MSGNGTTAARPTVFSAYQYFNGGLYASEANVGIANIDLLTVDMLSVNSFSAASAVVSLATLGATYSTTLNVSGATVLNSLSAASATLTSPLTAASGGTGLTSITAGQILYGNGTSAIATSPNVTYNGTTFAVTGTPSANLFKVAANSGGDAFLATALGAGNGTLIGSLNSVLTDFEPLQVTAEILHFNIRNGVGTSFEAARINQSGNFVVWDTVGSVYGKLNSIISTGSATPTLGTGSGHLTIGNGTYGLAAGVNTSGNAWMQAHRFDGTATAYDLLLQPVGGRVSIGTDSLTPSATLTVKGNVSIKSVSTGSSISDILGFYDSAGVNVAYVGFPTASNSDIYMTNLLSGGGLRFFTSAASMMFTNAGSLGINTDSPLGRLDARATAGAQCIFSYDASNYAGFTVNGSGVLTIGATGGGIILDAGGLRVNQTPAGSAGSATGTYMSINLNGTDYKIALLANA